MKRILSGLIILLSFNAVAQTRVTISPAGIIGGSSSQQIDPDYIITANPSNSYLATAIGRGELPDFSGLSADVWNNVILQLCPLNGTANSGGGRIRSTGVFNVVAPIHVRGWTSGAKPETSLQIDGGFTTVIASATDSINTFEATNGAAIVMSNISINAYVAGSKHAVSLFTDRTVNQQTEPSVWKFQFTNCQFGSGSVNYACLNFENFFGVTGRDFSARGFENTSMRLVNNSLFTNFGNGTFGGSMELLAPNKFNCSALEIVSLTNNHIMNLLNFEGALNIGTSNFNPSQEGDQHVGIRINGSSYIKFSWVDIEYIAHTIRIEQNCRQIVFANGYVHPETTTGTGISIAPTANDNYFKFNFPVFNGPWLIRDSTLLSPNRYDISYELFPDTSKVYFADRSRVLYTSQFNGQPWVIQEQSDVVIKHGLKVAYGTPGAGKILKSDAAGNVTLQSLVGSTAIVAANDLDLGNTGSTVYHIVGPTIINAINTTGLLAGSEITLIFDNSVTVKNNTVGGEGTAVMLLQGGVDFSATANDVLKLAWDGIKLFEVTRSVN